MPTILDAKNNLAGMLHGTSLDEIQNPNQVFERAARNLLSRIDPADTVRTAQITNAVHDEIYDYSAPTDLKGRKIIDIKPQVSRNQSQSFSQRFSKRFDLYKTKNSFQIRYNKGVKTLRASFDISPAPLALHNCDSLTANGTWAATANATNLTRDTLNYLQGGAALNFDLSAGAAGATGYLENSTMTKVDLADYDEIGQIFVRVYIPDATIITNFILRWGNDSSNYWHRTVTAPYDQSVFVNGWQILRFNWDGATEVGTVAPATVDYLRFTVTYNGTADTDLRLDQIDISSGEIWEIEYYSEDLFSTSGGTWQITTTDDTDTINLDNDGYNIFLYECVLAATQQIQGEDMAADVKFAKETLGLDSRNNIVGGLYMDYMDAHPSEVEKPKSVYYDVGIYNRKSR